MLAAEHRLNHLGIRYHPRRSTLSDANSRRSADVFGDIYYHLYRKYFRFLSDSQKTSNNSKLYILDTTTVSLFQEVLRTGGQNPVSGKRKGGIKVHSLIRSDQDVPCLIRYRAAAASNSPFLKDIYLPPGSIIILDRGYHDFNVFNRFTSNKVTWVTRRHRLCAYEVQQNYDVVESQKSKGIISDKLIILGNPQKVQVKARLIKLYDASRSTSL